MRNFCLLLEGARCLYSACIADIRADFPRFCGRTAGSGAAFGRDVFRRYDALRLPLCDGHFAAGGCAEPDTDSRYLNQCSYRLLFNTGGSTGKIWYFIILYIVLQRIEADLLYPKIVGKAVGLSELWVLAAVTIGASLGGVAGMIVCVPLFSVLYALLAEKVKRLLAEKNLHNL